MNTVDNQNNNNAQARLFIAIDMPQLVVQEVERVQTYFKTKSLFDGTYPSSATAHVTLRFLGNINQDLIGEIHLALGQLAFKALEAQLGSLNTFYKSDGSSILYIEVNCPELSDLAKKISDLTSPWLAPEALAFESHITIARIKNIKDQQPFLQELKNFYVNPLHFKINEFAFKQSNPGPQGSIYTDIARYKLQHI